MIGSNKEFAGWHPLDVILWKLEGAEGWENPDAVNQAIADYWRRPVRDYTGNYYAACALIPPEWRVEWWQTGPRFRCFVRKGQWAVPGCAERPAWALCVGAITAQIIEAGC